MSAVAAGQALSQPLEVLEAPVHLPAEWLSGHFESGETFQEHASVVVDRIGNFHRELFEVLSQLGRWPADSRLLYLAALALEIGGCRVHLSRLIGLLAISEIRNELEIGLHAVESAD